MIHSIPLLCRADIHKATAAKVWAIIRHLISDLIAEDSVDLTPSSCLQEAISKTRLDCARSDNNAYQEVVELYGWE
jgi:hypothetical protein